MFCSCTPAIYKPPLQAFSPHISRGYTAQQNSQPVKQDTHLHYFPTFEALTNKVEQALLKFANSPEEILALCSLPTELAQAA